MSSTESFSPACEPRKFEFEELAKATRYFSNEQRVGIGDFGDVYEGSLPGVEVNIVVKKLKYKQDEKQEEEFKNQIKDFGIVSHPNLVKLLGYCCEEADRLLVLEFVPNQSLRFHLSDENRRSNLNWSKRMKIAIGSARGLAHLHDECYPKIIHGDIKSDNILLDDDFTPKIAGFELAKFFPETNSVTHISSVWKGTNVYADLEDYYPQKDENIFQKISEKSDVYSFGVVLLELITGRTIFDEHRVDIVNWAKPFMFKGDSVEINYSCLVDSALKGDYIKSEMELMIYCAAVSVYRPPEFRPRMKQIVEALEGKMPSNELWVAEVNTGKASESRSSKAGDMSETTSSPFQELKEITEASNLHWSKATRLCKLFWENVGESIYSSNLQPLAQKVVDLCCYHSHAIFLMSKALKDESDVDVWNNAIETLNMQAASPEQELEHIMVNVLKFSYLRLPDDTTRRCLKNGALFFENEKIARKSLIDNWISDDLTDTYQKGRNVLETLVTAGLLERSEDGQFFTLHEIDRCILLEHVFPSIEGLFLMRNDSKLTELPKDVDWKEFHEIYLMDNKLTELSENLSCPKAQALFLQRNLKLRTISDSFFHGMLALQILNLFGTPIKYLPDPLFDLVKLKRFSLNHCVLLKLLPSRIGNLSCLEVFHLEGTQIIALPKEVERLKNLTSLKVSFREPLSFNQQTNMIPDGFIPNLTELKNLCIDVSPEDNRWKASVRRVVLDVSTLKTLDTLQFYFPNVELLSHFNWNTIPTSPPLSHFKFTVGDHTNRIIRRLPHDAEIELGRYDKCLKHVNGKGAPEEIKKVLRHASAFFLDRNTTVEKFSEFEITNMTQLKCCVAGECDKLQAIINGDQMVSNASGEREVGLQSLEYLYIYYARSLRSIWEGRLDNSSLKALKFLTLYMCPQLTTIFTPGLLANLSCLEELTVKDCSQVTRLVSGIDSENEIKHINLPLKKISLHFLPQLDRISDVLSIAQEMEWMSFYYCPNLKSLPISKASHTKLRKIKGEESWWKDILEWENTERDSWEGIFTPCGESEEFSLSFKRSDALLEATASPLLEETTSKSKSLTEGNPSETMILSQFRGKGAEISQSLNESDALEATASSLFEGEIVGFSPSSKRSDALSEATASSLFEGRIPEKEVLSEGCTSPSNNTDDHNAAGDDRGDYKSLTVMEPVYSISPKGKFRRSISSWQKGKLLGSGSFGTVYEGFTDDGFFFAVKEVSLLDQGSQGKQSILQLEQEISLLRKFEHENIIQYLGTDKDESKLYIFLELATKGSLAKLYQKYHLRDSQVSAYTRQILSGLKYLHDQAVVHRDIKCANILVDANGSVKLADFGLAKATKLNGVKSSKGTPYWMAPEVVNLKNRGYGLAADIWSLGCTVLEMLTGQPPYSHLEGMQASFRIGRGEPPHVPDSLSEDARDFIFKCLQVNSNDRPTATQLLSHPFVKRPLSFSKPVSPR